MLKPQYFVVLCLLLTFGSCMTSQVLVN